jgi:S1-C subfamily serine protease
MTEALALSVLLVAGAVLVFAAARIRARALRKSPKVAARRAAVARQKARLALAKLRVRAGRRSLARQAAVSGRSARVPLALGSAMVFLALAGWYAMPEDPDSPSVGRGTGFKVAEGFAVTNAHVAGTCDRVQVEVAGGFEDVKVVTVDEGNDLAVVTLPEGAGGDPLPVRAWPPLSLGDEVHTVGFPLISSLKSGARLHSGAIAGLTGYDNNAADVQFTGEIFSGNSGSPLLDDRANVVGVAKAMLRGAGGYNFATRAYALQNLLRAVQVEPAPEKTAKWEPRTVEQNVLKSVFVVKCERG